MKYYIIINSPYKAQSDNSFLYHVEKTLSLSMWCACVYMGHIKPQFPETELTYSLIKMTLEHFRCFLKELSD